MPDNARLRTSDLPRIALFAVLLAVCSWTSIPLPVPMTLQTFAVFLALIVLGGRRGTYAILVYLLLGCVGVPVFAGFRGGIGVLLGASGGYLLGFAAAGGLYWLAEHLFGRSLTVQAVSCAAGLLLCYGIGTAWFLAVYADASGPIALSSALRRCVFPFLLPDLLKLALALAVSRRLRRILP